MLKRFWAQSISIIGIAIGLITNALPQVYPTLPHNFYVLLLWLGGILFAVFPIKLLILFIIERIPTLISKWQFQWPIRRRVHPIPLNMGLFVGKFWASFKEFKNNNSLLICITFFNHLDYDIIIEGVRGKLNLSIKNIQEKSQAIIKDNLPQTVRAHSHDGSSLIFNITISNDNMSRIHELFDEANPISIDFREVILLVNRPGNQVEPINLYKFDGITCSRPNPDDVLASQVIFLGTEL